MYYTKLVALVLKNTLKGQDSKTKSTQALKTICGTNLGSLILIAISIAVILDVAKVSESMLGIMSIVGCGFIIYLDSSSLLGFFKQRKCGDSAQCRHIEPFHIECCHIESSEISHKSHQDSKPKGSQSEVPLENAVSGSEQARKANSLKSTKKTTQNKYSPFLQGLFLSLSNHKDILFFYRLFSAIFGHNTLHLS